MKNKKLEEAFENVELLTPSNTNTSVKDVIVPDENVPNVTDPEWHSYVMGLFTPDELVDGMPIVAGLRRVLQLVFGPIASSYPTTVVPPKEDAGVGRATVVWRVELANGQVFGDVADSWDGNTDDAFVIYSVATAATRAEARALRKALQIKTVAAEEVSGKNASEVVRTYSRSTQTSTEGEYDDSSRMTDPQAKFIDVKAEQVNVNVAKMFKDLFGVTGKKISKKIASQAIDKLNEFQKDVTSIPDELHGYEQNWR